MALKSDVCWGYIENSKGPIINSLTSYALSPSFYCEKVAMVCDTNNYQYLDPNDYVRRILADKPNEI